MAMTKTVVNFAGTVGQGVNMKFKKTIIITCFALLAGCAATIKRNAADADISAIPMRDKHKLVLNVSGPQKTISSKDWDGFKQEWLENFREQAEAAQIEFQTQEGESRATGEDGVLLSVFVNDYRFIRPGTRYAVGIFAGNAFIESKLSFSDLRTGESFGSQEANTSSSAFEGIFSAMTNKQVEAIAVDVIKKIKAGDR